MFACAQDWMFMVRRIYNCAPCWSYHGGFTYDEPNGHDWWYEGVVGVGACSKNEDGLEIYRIGNVDTSIQIYSNCEYVNFPGARFYVGDSVFGFRPSEGRFYSINGDLIYEGEVGWDDDSVAFPTGTYPMQYTSNKRFEAIWDGANMYLGETVNGIRHGWGIYIWSNGDCLYGQWQNGRKCGFGMKKDSYSCKCRWSYNWTDDYKVGNME